MHKPRPGLSGALFVKRSGTKKRERKTELFAKNKEKTRYSKHQIFTKINILQILLNFCNLLIILIV
ncbi:hypothetical protein OA86_13120 [Kaistella jeonii]|uniref:Uncharacterized protein n=1 Tax=Kaistella jeonii TaxID=266749 RepID=A0A0C1CUL7_9FLAO|nr:hypothetical protein OA86_13120 [Kaistella jeonii]